MRCHFLGVTDAAFSSLLRHEDMHTYRATGSGALIITHRTTALTLHIQGLTGMRSKLQLYFVCRTKKKKFSHLITSPGEIFGYFLFIPILFPKNIRALKTNKQNTKRASTTIRKEEF